MTGRPPQRTDPDAETRRAPIQVFSADQHPWNIKIPEDQISDFMHFPIPVWIFKSGARGWSSVREDQSAAASTYMAAVQFIGQMLKFVPMLGTNQGTEFSYNFVRPHPHLPDVQLMTPKIYPLITLVPKTIEDTNNSGLQESTLPEYKLFATDNQLGIVVTIISLDPALKIIDLVRAMVKENAAAVPEHQAAFVNEDANAHTTFDTVMDMLNSNDSDPDQRSEDDEDAEERNRRLNSSSCEQENARGRRGGRGRERGRRQHSNGGSGGATGGSNGRRNRGGAPRVDPLSLGETALFRQISTLRKALSAMIDATHGRQGDGEVRRMLCDNHLYNMRRALDLQIDSSQNPEVTLSAALSLDKVIGRLKAMLGPGVTSTNPQLDPTKYWEDCNFEGYPGTVRCFRMPIPEFTWEYDPQFMTASVLSRSEFPWATDVLRTYASVINHIYGIPIDAALTGIASQQISETMVSTALRTIGAPIGTDEEMGIAPTMMDGSLDYGALNSSAMMHSTDVYKRIGIVPVSKGKSSQSQKALTRGRDAPSAATAKVWNLLMNDDANGVSVMRTELRGVGKITNAAKSFVRLLTAAMVRILHDYKIPSDLVVLTSQRTKNARSKQAERIGASTPATPIVPTSAPTPGTNSGTVQNEDDLFTTRMTDPEEEAAAAAAAAAAARHSSSSGAAAAGFDSGSPRDAFTDGATQPVQCQAKRRTAIAELTEIALKEFCAMIDPAAARIQPALREVARAIRGGCSIELPFTIHSKNSGVFSNMISEIVLLFKYLRIATNNFPILILMIARDTAQMAPLIGALSMHPYVSSAFAGGKSLMWEILEKISVRWHIEYIMGSSPKGMLNVYGDPNEAPADGTVYAYDELPTFVTQATAKLSSDSRDVQSMMASVMTSSRRPTVYRTVQKDGEHIRAHQVCVDASFVMAGNTNARAPRDSVIVARMMPLNVAQSSVGVSRNAVNFMVAHSMGKVSDTVVTDLLKRLDMLAMLAFNAMHTGALPVPNMDLLAAHTATLIEHLQHERPEIVQAIRILEMSQTMAGVCTVWTALATVFSGQFGEARDMLARTGGRITPDVISLITPYLSVNYEIAYFVLAYVILSATDPTTYKIMRWLADSVGGYSFVAYAKTKDRAYSRGGLPATTVKQAPAGDAPVAAAADNQRDMSDDQLAAAEVEENELFSPTTDIEELRWIARFGDWFFDTCPKPSITCLDPASKTVDNTAQRQNKTNKRGASKAMSSGVGGNDPPKTVDEFFAMEGATVQLPLSESARSKNKTKLMTECRAILSGELCPEDFTEYKRTPVGRELMIDPNYILVRGSREYFATWFSQQNQHLKLSRENVSSELERMMNGSMLFYAHLIPLVRQSHDISRTVDVLTAVERYRVELLHDSRCLRRRVPMILPSSQGVYVLIEALLDSPKNLVYRSLDYLCCEGTPNLNMVMPLVRSRSTAHLMREYSARRVEGRVLMYTNPLYTPDEERPFMDQTILDALDMRSHCSPALVWNKDSELNSIREFFDEHGIDMKPEDYITEAIQHRIVDAAPTNSINALTAVAKAVERFDNEASAQQRRCDMNFTSVRRSGAGAEASAAQQRIITSMRIPAMHFRSGFTATPTSTPAPSVAAHSHRTGSDDSSWGGAPPAAKRPARPATQQQHQPPANGPSSTAAGRGNSTFV